MKKYLLYNYSKRRYLRGAKFWRWTRFERFAAQFGDRETWNLYLDRPYLVKDRLAIVELTDAVLTNVEFDPERVGLYGPAPSAAGEHRGGEEGM